MTPIYVDLAVLERCPLPIPVRRTRVLVDGVPVARCYAADEGAGTADCHMRDRTRRTVYADGEAPRLRYHGRVEVVTAPDVRAWLEAASPSGEVPG